MDRPAKKQRVDQAASDSTETPHRGLTALMGPANPQPADSGERSLQQTTDMAHDADASAEETEAGPKDWGRGEGDALGEDAALVAAHNAKRKGQTDEAMFAELARAEKEYEQGHTAHNVMQEPPGADVGSLLAGVTEARADDSSAAASAVAAPSAAAPTAADAQAARSDAGRKPGPASAELRQRATERLMKALHGNAQAAMLSDASVLSFAQAAERQAYDASTIRATYFSKIGNAATRLASQRQFGSIEQTLPKPAALQPGAGLPGILLAEADPSFVA